MPIYNLNLPDKSKYTEWVVTDQDMQKPNSVLLKLFELGVGYDSLKILTNGKNQTQQVTDLLAGKGIHCKIRETNWFKQGLNDTQNLNLIPNLEIAEVLADSDESEVFLQFMLGSFGVSFVGEGQQKTMVADESKKQIITNRFADALGDSKNKSYLVKINSQFVGGFSLVFMEDIGQVQLHSVAGKADIENIYGGRNKINILCSAAIQTLQNHPRYSQLLFSCSKPKVSQMYQNFGFQIDEELKCLVLV